MARVPAAATGSGFFLCERGHLRAGSSDWKDGMSGFLLLGRGPLESRVEGGGLGGGSCAEPGWPWGVGMGPGWLEVDHLGVGVRIFWSQSGWGSKRVRGGRRSVRFLA